MKQQKKNLIDTMVKTRFSPVEESTFSIYEEYESLLSPDDTDDICTLCFYRGEWENCRENRKKEGELTKNTGCFFFFYFLTNLKNFFPGHIPLFS